MNRKLLYLFPFFILLLFNSGTHSKRQLNINTIPNSGEYDSLCRLGRWLDPDTPLNKAFSLPGFTLDGESLTCASVTVWSVSNGYVTELGEPIGSLISIVPDFRDGCPSESMIETMDGIFTILVSDSPMAGYPEFPMANATPDLILNGLTEYRLIQKTLKTLNDGSFTRTYANFRMNDTYVYVRTRYTASEDPTVADNLLGNLDRVYSTLSGQTTVAITGVD